MPVVGMRMSWTEYESLHIAVICYADRQSLLDFLESMFFLALKKLMVAIPPQRLRNQF